ncbi:MAG: Sec-independent protein translocase protein TatB [Pseudomonadota bacterium]
MGMMELLLIGVVALIVVGPKDLPVMFQSLGKMTAKVRRMAREFSTAMNDAANATGAADVAKDLKGLTNPKAMGMDKLKEAADAFDKWEPGKEQRAMGSETAKLAAERAETARKIQEATAKREEEKRAAAAAAADTGPSAGDLVDEDDPAPVPPAPPVAKTPEAADTNDPKKTA